jgi:hypothetical protein
MGNLVNALIYKASKGFAGSLSTKLSTEIVDSDLIVYESSA